MIGGALLLLRGLGLLELHAMEFSIFTIQPYIQYSDMLDLKLHTTYYVLCT